MTRPELTTHIGAKVLLGSLLALTVAEPAWAVLGVWRRTAVRTTVAVEAATASSQAAAANSAAQSSAAAAQQATAAASQAETNAATAAAPASPPKTAQQKLVELQSLYDQKLISQQDYEAAKAAILGDITK